MVDPEVPVDGRPSIRLWGRRVRDDREGWFRFSAIPGSYHSILPAWVGKGDEVQFFEPLPDGSFRSLLLPAIEVAGGSVSRLLLEDGNVLLFSNIAGVHQSFYLLHPSQLEKLGEIIVDTVYMEEPCPACGYDWQGKIRSELIMVRRRFERRMARELERHPHLRSLLLGEEESGSPADGELPSGV